MELYISIIQLTFCKSNKIYRSCCSLFIVFHIAFVLLGALTLYLLQDIQTAASEFAGMGAQAIPAIIVYAVFNTAFSEEILFRGFLLKRLNSRFGFSVANAIQAFFFGLLHGIMFFSLAGAGKAILIILFTSLIAWLMGYIFWHLFRFSMLLKNVSYQIKPAPTQIFTSSSGIIVLFLL